MLGLQIYGGYTHRKAKNAEGEEVTRQAPRDMLRLSGSYDLSRAIDGLTMGGAVRWQSEVFPRNPSLVGPNGDQATQPSYTLADMFLRYQLTSQLSATLNVDNIFDKTYYSSVGRYVFGYYGQPRNVTAGLKWDF